MVTCAIKKPEFLLRSTACALRVLQDRKQGLQPLPLGLQVLPEVEWQVGLGDGLHQVGAGLCSVRDGRSRILLLTHHHS